MPRTKECPVRIKAVGTDDGLQPGQFRALVSVFGNVDSVGDMVMPGAFAKSLADWRADGSPIPVIWSHDWGDPFSHVGTVLEANETPDGLEVLAQIDDLSGEYINPKAQQVYQLVKGRRVKQFSFAYDTEESAWVDPPDGDMPYQELRQLKLYEVGPTLVGANQETELLAAKAAGLVRGLKEGRVLAQSHVDRLKEAHKALGDVIAAAEPQKNSEPSGSHPVQETGQQPAEETAATEQVPAKSPSGPSPAQVTAWADIHELTMRSMS